MMNKDGIFYSVQKDGGAIVLCPCGIALPVDGNVTCKCGRAYLWSNTNGCVDVNRAKGENNGH